MSLSQSPRKQSGFTLIELMVVMAIIAILATAGLSAYTGYLKKARDTTRIADVAAINTIIQGSLSSNGNPPADKDTAVKAANNDKLLTDPLLNKPVCFSWVKVEWSPCEYLYNLCDGGSGYLITAFFESKSNISSYSTVGSVSWYNIGSCKNPDGGSSYASCTNPGSGQQRECQAGFFCVTTSGGWASNVCQNGLLNAYCMTNLDCRGGLTCAQWNVYWASSYTCG